MKQLTSKLFSLLVILTLCITTQVAISQSKPKDSANTANSTFVKDTTIRNVSYPMYRGAKGGMYIIRTSKVTGNTYKQYLKKQ